jgi:hypothetical protein
LITAPGAERIVRLERCARLAQVRAREDGQQMRLLCTTYLLAASLEGATGVPSNATFRFGGLAAAVMSCLGALRSDDSSSGTDQLVRFYLRLRGRLAGSMFAPRDVQDAFAGGSSLERVALEPEQFETVSRLFVELGRTVLTADLDPDQRSLVAAVSPDRLEG